MDLSTIILSGRKIEGMKTDSKSGDAVLIVPADQEESVRALIKHMDSMETDLKELQAEVERKDGEIDALKESMTSPANLDKLVAERTAVLDVAQVNGLKADDIKTMSIPEIKRAIVAKAFPNVKNDASDDYIQGRYDVILDTAVKTAANKTKLNQLGGATSGRVDTKTSQQDVNDGDKSYRELAEARLAGLHDKTDEEIAKSGLN